MTSPTLRSVPCSSSGTMFSRIQGRPTSRATRVGDVRAGKREDPDQMVLGERAEEEDELVDRPS
jgi:hypothetical protein